MALPIWSDIGLTLNNTPADELFRLQLNGSTIYSGKAYVTPGSYDVEVFINDVCANYIKINTPPWTFHNQVMDDKNPISVVLQGYVGGAWTNVFTQDIFYDWSYDLNYVATPGGIAFPINGRMCDGMQFTYSVYQQAAAYQLDLYNGATLLMYLIPTSVSGHAFPFSGTLIYDVDKILFTAPQTTRVLVQGTEYTIVQPCHRFALYYVNEHGGWDFLLIEGNHKISDGVIRWNMDLFEDNSGGLRRQRVNYVNDIQRHYTLWTHPLTDDESSRMHHLLNSPNVWLLDMVEGRYLPVLLTNTETPYKTFISEGRTMYVYEINCDLAEYRERR